ncbi:MAG: Rrf2 family transcriptional regulator [Pyrinomonadaceae bacterium]|nr:Rrf2 family transcriptional regulator [Pyrinomonadaceae bacterium]
MANSSRFAIAVHTLALMSNCKSKAVKSEYIACLVKTNAVVIRRLFCSLSKVDLIETQSGASGGSWLKKDAENISLWEIYKAVETGEVFSLHKPSEETNCQISCNIAEVLTDIQTRIDVAIEKSLSQIMLSDVLQKLKKETFNDEICRKLNE